MVSALPPLFLRHVPPPSFSSVTYEIERIKGITYKKTAVLYYDEKLGFYELALQLLKNHGIFLVTDSVQEKGIRK